MATLLVVDDSALELSIAVACVEALQLDTVVAENGREALEVIRRQQPDVVLTDLQMPEMDGLELVRQIRRNYPHIPVILMTGYGSEETAAAALRAGAANYIAKKNLKQDLGELLHSVLETVEATRIRERLPTFLEFNEARFAFGYEPVATKALIGFLQGMLSELRFCDQAERFQISTALSEALTNAICHGNLELASDLREAPSAARAYRELGMERAQMTPYRTRRVHVTFLLTPAKISLVVRDEGPGFDPITLPDPTDPVNLTKLHGRGVMLIRMFMDEVSFNDVGNEITMVKFRKE